MTEQQRFVKKPVEVEAIQFTEQSKDRCFNFVRRTCHADFEDGRPILKVQTIHGDTAIVRLGDWIVKENAPGAYYPVKPDIFEVSYAPAAALSHAEGEAVGSLAIDKGGSELFRATVAMQDLDPGMYDLYTHPAPQVAVPEPVGWVKWFGDEPSFQPRDALLPEDAKQHGWQLVGLMRSMNAPTAPAGEQPVSDPDGLPDRVLMPRALTAENGAKTALMGEFDFSVTMTCPECHPDEPNPDCEVCAGSVEYEQPHSVPWATIKRIYSAAVDLLATPAPDERDRAVAGEQADRCISAINDLLDEREPWHSAQEMYDFLIRRDYSAQIASELSELWADSLNSARQRALTENAPDEREIAARAIEQAAREYFNDESGPHNLHDYLLWRVKLLRAGKEGE